MSGSDRTLVARGDTRSARRPPRAARMSKLNAGQLAQIDAGEARTKALTQAMAVKLLGAVTVREAERLRAKGWSAASIARHLDEPAKTIAALFGIVGNVG